MSYQQKQQRLRKYFEELFPYEALGEYFRDEEYPMSHRELSFSMLKDSGQEIYKRYVCVDNFQTELKKRLLEQSTVPHKFDLGGIYDRPVRARDDIVESSVWRCMRREFVLDIDMNDYDEIRTCCQGKTVCRNCWLFIAVAAEILHTSLRDQFGWTDILCVFSGRRGLHMWCRDRVAKMIEPEVRASIISYLSIEVDNLVSVRVADQLLSQKYIQQSLEIMDKHWLRFLSMQNPLVKANKDDQNVSSGSAARQQKNYDKLMFFIQHLAPSANITKIEESCLLRKIETSLALWQHLSTIPELEKPLLIIKLWFLAPRLDKGVSKDRKHLLKAPMIIHQGTDKLCCPLSITDIHKFDPSEDAPTLEALCAQDPRAIALFESYVGQLVNQKQSTKAESS